MVRRMFARTGDTHKAAAAVLSAEQGCMALAAAAAAAGQWNAVLGTPVAAEVADETLRQGAVVTAAGMTAPLQGWAVGRRTAAHAAAGGLQAVIDTQRPEQAAPLGGSKARPVGNSPGQHQLQV
jgi:hypothetical protein